MPLSTNWVRNSASASRASINAWTLALPIASGGSCGRRCRQFFAASPVTIPLLRRFNSVVIDDCTSLGLPAALARQFPGCGGSDPEAGQAGLKLLVRFEVTSGQFQALELSAARDSERTLFPVAAAVAPGELAPG